MAIPEQVAASIGQYWAVLVGILIVAAYARQRFNEPTFPNREALPRTLEPLRYLFLKPAYERARRIYVLGSVSLYVLMLLPGPEVIKVLGIDAEDFPPQAWALLVALLLVGLLPTANVKWLSTLEETLRRGVHEWFLVPAGVKRTIGILEDARFDPPAALLEAIPDAQRERLEADLKLKRSSLRHHWARAALLMACLGQMGGGAAHPLRKAAFEPFEQDFEDIRARFKALAQDIPPAGKALSEEKEESLKASVESLLRRIYAYISWGIRQQADSDSAINRLLEELGFSILLIESRSLFDIVAPAVLLVAGVTMGFWLVFDAATGALFAPSSNTVHAALTSATAASIMYGWSVFIALRQRGALIEQQLWREGSPGGLVPIALRAGLVTWLVIVVSTVTWQFPQTLQSLSALIRFDTAAMLETRPPVAAWDFLPMKIVTALPWLLAGGMASAVLASRLSGDARRIARADRARDAISFGLWLGLAVATAQLLQTALAAGQSGASTPISYQLVPVMGLVGLICGAIMGFMVPYACRANVMAPANPQVMRALQNLLLRAEAGFGSKAAAEQWVFTPHNQLRGITPAEAIQYPGYANTVRHLLENEAPQPRPRAVTPGETPMSGRAV